jgi:hypothetical protein
VQLKLRDGERKMWRPPTRLGFASQRLDALVGRTALVHHVAEENLVVGSHGPEQVIHRAGGSR